MFHHSINDRAVVLRLVIRARELLIEPSTEPVLREFAPGRPIGNRAVSHGPDMFDRIDSGVRRSYRVPAVRSYRNSQVVCFITSDLDQIHGKKFVDFQYLASKLALSLNRLARLVSRRHNDVVTRGPGTESIVTGADSANRPTGHPNSRTANFPQCGSLFLRTRPGPVLIELNIRTRGYS